MFFKLATSFVAVFFGGLIVVGLRQRAWMFAAINLIGMALNVAVVLLDILDHLNMTILMAALLTLVGVFAADVNLIFRDEKPNAVLNDESDLGRRHHHQKYLLITNDQRLIRELEQYSKLSAKVRQQALQFWQQGNAAFQQRDTRSAEAQYELSLKLTRTPSALNNLAAVLLATSRAAAALQRCEAACALDSEHLEAWLNRGSALFLLKRVGEAFAIFDQTIALQPNMLQPWIFRANVLMQMGHFEQSIQSYEAALCLNPNRPECWNNHGVALSKMGRWQEAMTSFERALKIESEYYPATLNRMLIMDRLGRFEQAKLYYRAFLKQPPPAMNGNLVFVRSRLQQLESGVVPRIDLNPLELELAL